MPATASRVLTPAEILAALRAHGADIALLGDRVMISGAKACPADLVAEARARRAELCAHLRSPAPDDEWGCARLSTAAGTLYVAVNENEATCWRRPGRAVFTRDELRMLLERNLEGAVAAVRWAIDWKLAEPEATVVDPKAQVGAVEQFSLFGGGVHDVSDC